MNGDADFDADGAGLRRREPEAERRAVGDAGRHRERTGWLKQRRRRCRRTRRTASVHDSPRPPHAGQVPRTGSARCTTWPPAASRCDTDTSAASDVGALGFAEKRVAHAVDDAAHGRKVDRDFVGETSMRHVRTIGAGIALVKVAASAAMLLVCPRMARKECPLCGEPMQRRDTQTTTQIPGNPKPTTYDRSGMGLPGLRLL